MDIRQITAAIIAPALRVTGFRFDKSYRWAESGWKAVVYKFVSTPVANLRADGEYSAEPVISRAIAVLGLSALLTITALAANRACAADLSDPLAGATAYDAIDIGLEAIYDAAVVVDSHQTNTIRQLNQTCAPNTCHFHEVNPLMGSEPGTARVRNASILNVIGHGYISYLLPRPYRELWQGVSADVEVNQTLRNNRIGLGFSFRL